MQTQKEQVEEMVDTLQAISIISKRLARNLTRLEELKTLERSKEKENGRKKYTRVNTG